MCMATRNDHTARTVDHADHHIGIRGDERCHLGLRAHHRDHAAYRLFHQATTGADQTQPIFQREDTGRIGRSKVAQAVAEDQIRLNPPALPEVDQGTFQRKVNRLPTRMRVDQVIVLRGRGWVEQFDQRTSEHLLRHHLTAFDYAAEDRLCFIQTPSHA